MIRNKQRMLWLLVFILLLPSFAMAQPPLPCGIGGVVTIDGIPTGGITVQIENTNTGEVRTTTTSFGNPPHEAWEGYYTVAVSGQNDHIAKITVSYGGISYYNTTTIDLKRVTQWLNLSIETDKPPNGDPDDPYNSHPPPAEEPEDNETETPEENETGNITMYLFSVEIIDNDTGAHISNATVTVYYNESKIAMRRTNDTGKTSFLLEEGAYTVEVMKEGYQYKSEVITLLCSIKQSFSLEKTIEGTRNPNPTEGQGIPLHIYGSICVITVIILGVIVYRRLYQ